MLYEYKHLITMNTISVNYNLIYQFRIATHYKVSKCGRVFNTKTGKEIKRSFVGYSSGYWISINGSKKFITLNKGRVLEKIPKEICPF